ncbi:hypothetical protein WJX74_007300 [Apatococcus lobatus]|uniref:Uncharacterized protein n=2 Tax=Apatococcus TaxID=904362 RepID=A0AAW1SPW0_9CHLO
MSATKTVPCFREARAACVVARAWFRALLLHAGYRVAQHLKCQDLHVTLPFITDGSLDNGQPPVQFWA